MGIIDKLKARREYKEKEKELNRDVEEQRLDRLQRQESRELEQESRISQKRQDILRLRAEKRKVNPSFIDKIGNMVGGMKSTTSKPMYKPVGRATKEAGIGLFNTSIDIMGSKGITTQGMRQGGFNVLSGVSEYRNPIKRNKKSKKNKIRRNKNNYVGGNIFGI